MSDGFSMFRMTCMPSARLERPYVTSGVVIHSIEASIQEYIRDRCSIHTVIGSKPVKRPRVDRSWLRFSEVRGDRTRIERRLPC